MEDLSEHETSLLGHRHGKKPKSSNFISKTRYWAFLLLNLTLFGVSLLMFGGSLTTFKDLQFCKNDYKSSSLYSPLESVREQQIVLFDGDIDSQNEFKGPPSPEIDRAWSYISDVPDFFVSREELQSNNLSSITLDRRPNQYLVQFDVFHSLHCLDYVRKYVHKDYYEDRLPPSKISHLQHVAHCIDVIRQNLQCNADITMLPFEWNPKYPNKPTPLFSKYHQCSANFQKLLDFMYNQR